VESVAKGKNGLKTRVLTFMGRKIASIKTRERKGFLPYWTLNMQG